MALVFKIKCQDILRRWVVSDDFNSSSFCLSFSQLEDKIRDLFHLSHTTALFLTYVDKDNDVVTLEDDQDLVDACVVQQLNPLRLDVCEKLVIGEPTTKTLICFTDDGTVESLLTTDGENQKFVKTSTKVLDMKHSSGFLLKNWKNLAGSVLPHTPALSDHKAQYVFHRGVQCDGCGMNPIEGPRYKSNKIPDYDLCGSCFDQMGTDADFEKIDYPSNGHFSFLNRGVGFHFLSFKDYIFQALSRHTLAPTSRSSYTADCPFSGQRVEYSSKNRYSKKFDARFVEDVTVLDGAEIEPGINFIKTWRMQNNGTVPWPLGTQLAHIGGSTLSTMEVVNLELPESGLPCGREVDICADLVAPKNEGRYVAHWRLILPSGQFFGHTVWVVIQVKSKPENFNMELSHCEEGRKASPEKKVFASPGMLGGRVDSCGVVSDEKGLNVSETEGDIELDGFSVIEKPIESNCIVSVDKESSETNLDTHMKVLETMGFESRESNLFWLKRNNGNFEGTLKDLLMNAGWEDKVRNLKEMGFNDQTINIQLLHKHRGSIKLVVKHLVAMENEANRKDTLQTTVV